MGVCLSVCPSIRMTHLHVLECAEIVEEDAVWFVLLSCIDPRKMQVWSARLEYTVRIQRDGPQNFCAAAGHVPQ